MIDMNEWIRTPMSENPDFDDYFAEEDPIDWSHWETLPTWTSKQAACLLLLLDPDLDHPYHKELMKLQRETSVAKAEDTPHGWVKWAADKGRTIYTQLMPLLDANDGSATGLGANDESATGLDANDESATGLDVFKVMKITASELAVTMLRKDENSLPDRMKLTARDKTRIVTFSECGLINKKNGLPNRAGNMLVAMQRGRRPDTKLVSAPEQAVTDLRKLFRRIVFDNNPFHPKRDNWKPRFTLKDQIEESDKRARKRATHVQFNDGLNFDKEVDAAGNWLNKHDI